MRDDCLRAALSYVDRGWAALALCPPRHQDVTDYHAATCKSPGKRPLGRWRGWQSRLPTLEELAAQWELVPRANVGVLMGNVSGVIGIDVDGEAGQRLLREASGDEGTPNTLTFRTARGVRLLYALEPETTVRSWSIRRGGSEIKVLGEGGLTVMPPSRHVTGKTYRWLRRRGPGHVALEIAPGWTRAPRRRRPRRSAGAGGRMAVGYIIPEGERNETLFRIGCALRGRGASGEEIHDYLSVLNERCRPPLPQAELEGIVKSITRYPRSASPRYPVSGGTRHYREAVGEA
jgi:hypothetical protein